MQRADVVSYLATLRQGVPTVVSPGATGQLLEADGDDPLIMYQMDMPYTTPLCLGIALANGERKVLAMDGDGSLLAGLGILSTIARYRPPNLIVVVFDNERYLSPGHGDFASATATGTDLARIADASGILKVREVRTLQDAKGALDEAFGLPGPWAVVAKVDSSDIADPHRQIPRSMDIVETAVRFKRALNDASYRC